MEEWIETRNLYFLKKDDFERPKIWLYSVPPHRRLWELAKELKLGPCPTPGLPGGRRDGAPPQPRAQRRRRARPGPSPAQRPSQPSPGQRTAAPPRRGPSSEWRTPRPSAPPQPQGSGRKGMLCPRSMDQATILGTPGRPPPQLSTLIWPPLSAPRNREGPKAQGGTLSLSGQARRGLPGLPQTAGQPARGPGQASAP